MATSTVATWTEPECCGAPMVHNTYREGFECADAFFYLEDEDLVTGLGELRTWAVPVSDFDRERHAHWRAMFVPDSCWDAALALAGQARHVG